jgi:hypothetical protein
MDVPQLHIDQCSFSLALLPILGWLFASLDFWSLPMHEGIAVAMQSIDAGIKLRDSQKSG